MTEVEIMWVSSKSSPNAVAGFIAGILSNQETVTIQVIGAGALNQAIKAIIIARGFVAPSGTDLVLKPYFVDLKINGEERTAIGIVVEEKRRGK